jgi:hypothetical protein
MVDCWWHSIASLFIAVAQQVPILVPTGGRITPFCSLGAAVSSSSFSKQTQKTV